MNEETAPPNWTNLFHYHTENYDANNFEDINASEGDYTSLSDTLPSEGDHHPDSTSIIAPLVQELLNGDIFDNMTNMDSVSIRANDIPIPTGDQISNTSTSEGELHSLSPSLSSEGEIHENIPSLSSEEEPYGILMPSSEGDLHSTEQV